MEKNCSDFELKHMLISMVKLLGENTLKMMWKTRALGLGMLGAKIRRKRTLKKGGLQVPMGIGLSPTMRCNLSCRGCYARLYPKDEEMPLEVIESLVSSAAECGVFLFVITGGEPFMRPELMDIYRKNHSVLFLVITNGTLMDEDIARDIAKSGNIFPVVSIEGTQEQTDQRRGSGVYTKVIKCMNILKNAGISFGFSAVLTRLAISTLGSIEFVSNMVNKGCTFGFFNELVPLSSEDMHDVPDDTQRLIFKRSLNYMREKLHIVLVHLPDDEYGKTGRCMAVGGGGMHINAQGYVEPCPFAHFACENVKNYSFKEILKSPFLEAIRKHPTVLERGDTGCSLVSNRSVLEEIARSTGAKATDIPVKAQNKCTCK